MAAGIDRQARPVHVGRIAVVDPPAIAERCIVATLDDSLGRDRELHRVGLAIGQLEHDVSARQHRHHDRSHDAPIRREDDLHRTALAIEAEVPLEVASQPQVGLVGNAIGIIDHGAHGTRPAVDALWIRCGIAVMFSIPATIPGPVATLRA